MTLASARYQRLDIFGPPLLLEGEDADAYGEFLARACAAVEPADVIDEMFVVDVVFWEWEILRLRRLKTSLIRAAGNEELKNLLPDLLDDDLCREYYLEPLAEMLQGNVSEDEGENAAHELARRYLREEPEAVEKVHEVIYEAGFETISDTARASKAEELAGAYARREPKAIKQVHELLAVSGQSMHDVYARALMANIDELARIDHLMSIAENRRSAILCEIDRRRAVLGEALRRKVQLLETDDFKVIETTPGKEKARRDE
jgi:hypothetical protein